MRWYITAILMSAVILTLPACGILAEVGVLDESYKGSFIRGDLYADLCTDVFDGEWTWKPGVTASCSRGPVDFIIEGVEDLI